MARVLLVGCGCRGAALAAALVAAGNVVRGTTRAEQGRSRIAAAGAEPAVADPNRLGTLMPHLEGVSALAWLMGSARADAAALHGPRLGTLLETLVDTPVRGFVYEAAGSVDPALLAGGADLVREAATRWRMPVEVVEAAPAEHGAWLTAMSAAVERVLGSPAGEAPPRPC